MRRAIEVFLAFGLLATAASAAILSPADAIRLSEKRPAAFGTYSFVVQATGSDRGWYYLNSEPDYRSPENLSVAISPLALRALEGTLGKDLAKVFQGKAIWVKGDARKVPIVLVIDGKPTNRGYYQHHVDVTRADQISLTPPPE
jgi:hypothetical protein